MKKVSTRISVEVEGSRLGYEEDSVFQSQPVFQWRLKDLEHY